MTVAPVNPQVLSQDTLDMLATAYKTLLADRQGMIQGTESLDQSTYFCEILVDSIIYGLMEHFAEFARMPSEHPEILFWGPTLDIYIANRIAQANAILTQLPKSADSAPRQTQIGRQPGRRDEAVPATAVQPQQNKTDG